MDDQRLPSDILRREIGRRKIQGTNKIEIVYAIRNPLPPYDEHLERVIITEREVASKN